MSNTQLTIWMIFFGVIGAIGVAGLIASAAEKKDYASICAELDGVAIHADGKSHCIKREALLHAGQK